MNLYQRAGYTLRDLIVVIGVIGVLMAFLSLGVTNSRDGGSRRASCANRQRQLCLAMLTYQHSQRHLPGYVNSIGVNEDPKDPST